MSKKTMIMIPRVLLSIVLGALLILGFYIATGARADSGPNAMMGPRYEHHGAMNDFVGHTLHGLIRSQKELGLSAEQKTKIKAIATEHAKSRIQEEADVKLAELDVRTDIFNEKVELPTIETALQKSESARAAMRLEGVKALRAARAVLSPEQREKWHQKMMSGREAGDWGKGYGHGPMGNPHDHPKKEG
jgi:Spy/CpxP family protein refolding chaperone